MSKSRTGWDYVDFDCFIEYTLLSVEAIRAITTDPDWPATLKDEAEWVDTSKALASLGRIPITVQPLIGVHHDWW
ncbi:hypothetical protein F4779DRAFT_584462 [Xylariaceae sp. FL0662B]|nr:hypothetical protein F4779DRAFT_584462 [Xylariaceae sp. FL0662B]